MFDELKDPRPPQVTDVHIVSVIARAHRIRRRQRIAMFTTSAAFAGAIGGLALVSRGPSSSTNVEFASGASTDAPAFQRVVLATTIALPASTLAPQAIEGEAPPLTEPAVAGTEAPAVADGAPDDSFQARPTGAVNNAGTSVPPSVPTVVSAVEAVAKPTTDIPSQFVAVAAETGDLVRVDTSSGAATVLVPATQTDPGSAGGTITATLTAGGITPDGASAYYSDSTSGAVYEVTIASPEPDPPAWGPGIDPKLSPNGSRWILRNPDSSTISVHSQSESDQTLGSLPRSTVVDYAWYSDDEVALLEHDGSAWTVSVIDASLTKLVNSSTIDDPYVAGGPDAVNLRFVGRTVNGLLLAAQRRVPGPDDPPTVYLWVRPGPGSEDRWSSSSVIYNDITVDRNGEWLLRLAADGTLSTDAVSGQLERKVAGTYKSVAW